VIIFYITMPLLWLINRVMNIIHRFYSTSPWKR